MRLVFVSLALGTSLMRFAGACWFESASSSKFLSPMHCLSCVVLGGVYQALFVCPCCAMGDLQYFSYSYVSRL